MVEKYDNKYFKVIPKESKVLEDSNGNIFYVIGKLGENCCLLDVHGNVYDIESYHAESSYLMISALLSPNKHFRKFIIINGYKIKDMDNFNFNKIFSKENLILIGNYGGKTKYTHPLSVSEILELREGDTIRLKSRPEFNIILNGDTFYYDGYFSSYDIASDKIYFSSKNSTNEIYAKVFDARYYDIYKI